MTAFSSLLPQATGFRARARAWRWKRAQARLAGPRLIRAFAKRYPQAVFVEVGANDGEQHDHLRPMILKYQWRGVMVEPVPYVFERLKENYGAIDRVALENSAIAAEDGKLPFYHLAPSPDYEAEGLPQWYDGIGSFSKEAVLDHRRLIPDIDERLVETMVPSLTFTSLCRKHHLDSVDLLLVDTEGHDYEILRHIDFSVYRPTLVTYEHYHLSADDRAACSTMMRAVGYAAIEEGFDTWCLRVDSDDALGRQWRSLRPALPPLTAEAEPR